MLYVDMILTNPFSLNILCGMINIMLYCRWEILLSLRVIYQAQQKFWVQIFVSPGTGGIMFYTKKWFTSEVKDMPVFSVCLNMC